MILAADVGGTKVLLGLEADGKLIAERRYASVDFSDFESVLAAYLAEASVDVTQIRGGCLAVAGPVADDGVTAKITNLPWRIDTLALSQRFGLPPLQLVNDFVAAAQGAVTAPPNNRVTLQAGEPRSQSPCLVIGAGTGLGMAIAVPEAGGWRILPGEGGHVAFAPADAEQEKLLVFLRARHGRVIWEHVVSGPGLTAIHEFLSGQTASPEEITAAALADNGSREYHALNLFLAAYGAYAGDMALATLARGGVYLAGGIVGRLLALLPQSRFLAAFNHKADHAMLTKKMPLYVVTDPLLGLRGALRIAASHP
jgi:glucokinase